MSQATLNHSTSAPAEQAPAKDTATHSKSTKDLERHEFVPAADEINQFDYRPMPIIAPVAAVLALLSSLSLIGIVGVVLAFASTLVGLYAWRTIASSEGAYSGLKLALGSWILSLGFFAAGTASQIHAYQTEVPAGYKRVSFARDIAAKGFVMINNRSDIHPEVKPLVDQKVFLKGFIYPPSDPRNLREFLLLKDTGECCFGGKPSQTDMILVQIKNGRGINYREGLYRMAVAGTLKVDPYGQYEGGLAPVYVLEVDNASLITRAKTSF